MKKATLIALSMMLMGLGSLKAQVFMTNSDVDNNRSSLQVAQAAELLGADPIPNNSPLGKGTALLAAFGGCYLLGKKINRNRCAHNTAVA